MATENMTHQDAKSRTKFIILAVNAIIVAIVVLVCFSYVASLKNRREENVKKSFSVTTNSMRRVARTYIELAQRACTDWAYYINSQDMTVDEVINFLANGNSVDGVMAQIVDFDTMKGFSVGNNTAEICEVDYSSQDANFNYMISEIHNGNILNLTHTYINPVDDNPTVGFCEDIVLRGSSGERKHYILIRTITLDMINESWSFPSEYEDAEISVVNIKGDFVIRSRSMESDNVWNFMLSHNPQEFSSPEDVAKRFTGNTGVTYQLKDDHGDDSYYVCLPFRDDSERFYIGYVPKSSITSSSTDYVMVIVVTIGFLILVAFNGTYIFLVNHKLKMSIEETKSANMAKTKFLSSMSHDIRTPMNAIIGITALAQKHTDDPEYISDGLKKISRASNHLLTLVNDILDISKVETGKLSLNPTVFSIAESVNNIVSIVRPLVAEKDLSFEVHICNIRNEYLYADELRLNQIFINLVTNSIKYTNSGGTVCLEFTESPCPDDDKAVLLTFVVADTGIGMTEEFQKTMYQNFVRASDSRIDKIQGSGLGLAITKQMVDLMNGKITCKSKPQEGTTFTVELKLPLGDKKMEEMKLPDIRVLVVDDDERFLETAKDTLESLGAVADTIQSGSEAIELAKKKKSEGSGYQLVIVDWRMPGMDGIETIKQMRRREGIDAPIIVVSAYDWTEIEAEALDAGATGFVNKPFFRSNVFSAISKAMNLANTDEHEDADVPFDLSGLELLIAEDNDINWEIIEESLSDFGIKSDRAENGKICVEMLQSGKKYDAVLMDVQMPVMNGHEASREIRKLEDKKLNSIPIIAMTADAFAEDVRACLEAGMNAHVSKPIDLGKLFDALRKVGLSGKNDNTLLKGEKK